MKKIVSNDNKIFKTCQQLATRKYRDKLGKYIIEGPNLIEEAIKNQVEMDTVIVSVTNAECIELNKEIQTIVDKLQGLGFSEIVAMENKLFEKIAQTESSQGILSIVNKKIYKEEEFFSLLSNNDSSDGEINRSSGNIIVLDRLQDPGNLGTIIRTADAAGYGGIAILKGTVDIYSPKVVRACTGSLFRMPVIHIESPKEALDILRKYNKKVISTSFDTELFYFDVDLSKDIALVIGNEGNGICDAFIDNSDLKIKIPMAGNIESLNAAVAAGILMYESIRRR